MTSLYRNGMFWLIDSVTFIPVKSFPPFATLREAREAAGNEWEENFTEI